MKDDKKMETREVKDRRALLKGIVAGSAVVTGSKALPETWTKPISDAVILPGHARTTQNTDYITGDYVYTSDGYVYEDGSSGDEDEINPGDFDYGEDDYGTDDDHNNDDYEFIPKPPPCKAPSPC